VVAQRLGFDEDEALTLGNAVAGLHAQAKGRRLRIFKPHEEQPKKSREKERGERFWVEVLGRPVPATNTDDGIRPEGRALGDAEARQSLQAPGTRPQRLPSLRALPACHPRRREGWGARGELDLGVIGRLAKDT
jgi:hypothetical protein